VTRDESTISQRSDQKAWSAFPPLGGALVAALAVWVIVGWVVRVPWMVQIIPGATAMVFTNAVCMLLLGVSLLLTSVEPRWCKLAQTTIGSVVLLTGVIVMLQYRFDLVLPLDMATLHGWLNNNPGRMAPNTALAHVLAGATVVLVTHSRPGPRALPALAGAFAVTLLGVTGLIGYKLHPELLYGWHIETRMALHSGAAFVLLGIGYAAALYRTQQLEVLFHRREDLRVGLIGGALMVFVGTVGGIVSFSMIQDQMLSALRNGLELSFHSRHDLIVSEISSSIDATRNIANRPGVQRELAHLRTNPGDPAALEFLKATLTAIADPDLTGVRLFDARGQLVASVGTVPSGRVELPLRGSGNAAVTWGAEAAALRVAEDIEVRGRRLGRIESSFALPGITRMREVALGFGASGDMVLCVRPAQVIQCLPTVLHPERTEIPSATPTGPVLMAHVLAGETGVGLATDYRGERVIAAYGPVGNLGLGLVLKVDAAEIYRPLRARFELTLLVIALLIAAGILVLRARLVPLVRRLALSEQRVRNLLESAPDAMLVTDLDGRIVWVNSQTERLFGYTRAELIGQPVELLVPESAREAHIQHRTRYSREPMNCDMGSPLELRGRRKDGREFPVHIRLSPQETEVGPQVISTVRDISEPQRVLEALRESEERWQFALEGARDGVWDWNLVTNAVFFSRQWKQMLGFEEHEIGSALEEWEKRVHPEDKPQVYADIQRHLKGETRYYQNEHRVQCKDGRYKWILDRGMIVARDASGKPTRMIGTHTDITERKRSEEAIRSLSLVDDLTGLQNRRGFFVLGERQLNLARRLGQTAVVYFADVDGLKRINDESGHAEGDRALVAVAEILRATFRETDIIARLGGDEFVVLALEATDADAAISVARLEEHFRAPNRTLWRARLRLAVSTGIAQATPESRESLQELVNRADADMYRVKEQRRAAS